MPLDEEGAKWSCEPCIRGHRSSKCQHFDRLMMKVPKAGRPLAKCPHPKGTCSCQKSYAFMIRIPKGSSCVCRPVYQVPVNTGDPSPSLTPTPIAPTPSTGSGKIQKASKRQVKTAPENIAKALYSIPEFKNQHTANDTPSNLSPYIDNSPNGLNHAVGAPGASVSNQTVDLGERSGGSCCSQKPKPPPQPQPQAQASCCAKPESSKSNNHCGGGKSEQQNGPYNPSLNEVSYTQVSTAQIPSWQNYPTVEQSHYMQPFSLHQSQTGVPAYATDYMSHATPKTSMGFPHNGIPSSMGFTQDILSTSLPQHQQNGAYTMSEAVDSDPTHDCSCGENCQCLGCASHPFNNTTRQHVQEMGLLVAFDGDNSTAEGLNNFQNPPSHRKRPSVSPLDYSYTNFSHQLSGGAQPVPMHPYGQQIPNSNNLNNGYSSPTDYASGQQLMEPSEYYTLEYPVGLPSACSDVTGSCQCGNDCCCVGCLTHSGHNGFALESTPAQSNNLSPVQSTPFSGDDQGINPSQIHMLDNITIPSSTSML